MNQNSTTTFPDKEQRQNYYVKNKSTYVKLGVTPRLPKLGDRGRKTTTSSGVV